MSQIHAIWVDVSLGKQWEEFHMNWEINLDRLGLNL